MSQGEIERYTAYLFETHHKNKLLHPQHTSEPKTDMIWRGYETKKCSLSDKSLFKSLSQDGTKAR